MPEPSPGGIPAAAAPGPTAPEPAARLLVVLDDDPTGTQTVSDVPVVTRWRPEDVRWALGRGGEGFCVLTNTRSLDTEAARDRTREVVRTVLAACAATPGAPARPIAVVSRGDSTLRGHHVDEVEVVAAELAAHGDPVDAVVMVPAFPSAGRVTVDGVHHVREGGRLVPAGESSFAADATFGYAASDLPSWLAERSGGRLRAADVETVGLDVVRGGTNALADVFAAVGGGRHVVLDAETDDDLERVALACREAERRGRHLLYRIAPGLLRPLLRQAARPALRPDELARHVAAAHPATPHGLVVVGSHVPLTTRQVEHVLRAGGEGVAHVVLDVVAVLDADADVARAAVASVVDGVLRELPTRDVLVTTSRLRVDGVDGADSLRIARTVSRALVELTRAVLAAGRPAFVVGKGGITSSDLATEAVGLRRLVVLGPLLPGAVSIWVDADDEPARDVGPEDRPEAHPGSAAPRAFATPYAVFPGNVGADGSLWDAIEAFRAGVKATG